MINLVGFTGFKGSGKTTIARAYSKLTTRAVNHIGFADPLYEMMIPLGFTVAEVTDPTLRDIPQERLNGKTIRHALQTLGTEWGRNCISEDIWCDRALARCLQGHINIIDNVRFENESNAIKNLGGIIVTILRPDAKTEDFHESEIHIDNIMAGADFVIDNTSTVDVAVAEVVKVIEERK